MITKALAVYSVLVTVTCLILGGALYYEHSRLQSKVLSGATTGNSGKATVSISVPTASSPRDTLTVTRKRPAVRKNTYHGFVTVTDSVTAPTDSTITMKSDAEFTPVIITLDKENRPTVEPSDLAPFIRVETVPPPLFTLYGGVFSVNANTVALAGMVAIKRKFYIAGLVGYKFIGIGVMVQL